MTTGNRHHRVDLDFVQTGEFRTLLASYRDVKGIKGPMMVMTAATQPAEDEADHGMRSTGLRSAAHRVAKWGRPEGAPIQAGSRCALSPPEVAD